MITMNKVNSGTILTQQCNITLLAANLFLSYR